MKLRNTALLKSIFVYNITLKISAGFVIDNGAITTFVADSIICFTFDRYSIFICISPYKFWGVYLESTLNYLFQLFMMIFTLLACCLKNTEGRGVSKDDFLNWKGLLYVYSLRDWTVFVVWWRFMRPSVSLFLLILSVTLPLIRAVLSPKTPAKVSVMQASSSPYL